MLVEESNCSIYPQNLHQYLAKFDAQPAMARRESLIPFQSRKEKTVYIFRNMCLGPARLPPFSKMKVRVIMCGEESVHLLGYTME